MNVLEEVKKYVGKNVRVRTCNREKSLYEGKLLEVGEWFVLERNGRKVLIKEDYVESVILG